MMDPRLVPTCPSCPQMYRMDTRMLDRGLGQVAGSSRLWIALGIGAALFGAYVLWAWSTSPTYERWYPQPLFAED